ncbi:MAG: GNAT family N-acetyltransferase [Gammaproteobacteria bacterium]|nr:GNAT family N-acetyltransferase [Gammaproteobacteria bacterium]MDH5650403.1 GNAT family N-acetyltransferase [Gammaproteobacteria bacterium]
MGINIKLYHSSTEDIPWDDWEQVRRSAQDGMVIGMEPDFLAIIERTMGDCSKIWYALIYDDNQQPVAVAVLTTLTVDLAIMAGKGIQRTVNALRKIKSSLMKVTIMFVGIPVSIGQKGMLFVPGADQEAILAELDKVVVRLGKQEKAPFACYKEHIAEELDELQPLLKLGYLRQDSLDMHVFNERFSSFEDYLSNLSSHRRHDVKRSLRKVEKAGVEIKRYTSAEDICRLYTTEIHAMYNAVVDQSDNKFEILPREFFLDLASSFAGKVALTCLVQNEKILAYNWSLNLHDHYHFMFCGNDYSLNNKLDLYFNLMYAELDYAFKSGASEIHVGQTAPHFKMRMGCVQLPLYLYIKGTGVISNLIIKLAGGALFPKRQDMEPADIYNSKYKAKQQQVPN